MTAVVIFSISIPSLTWAQEVSFEQLLEQIGSKRQSIVVPMLTKDRKFGDIKITLQGDTLTHVHAKSFIQLLPITQKTISILQNKVSDTGLLGIEDLELLGFQCVFDSTTLSISVSIPLDRMSLQYLSYYSSPIDLSNVNEGTKDDYSFYANFRYGESISRDDFSQKGSGSSSQTTRLGSIDSALSIRGWVLESGAVYSGAQISNNTQSWSRADTRISHDIPDWKMRFLGGDLAYPITGFQRFNSMAGIGLSSNKRLDPYRVSQPTGHQSFQLEQASNVEILINNRLVRRLYLLRGNYNVKDLPGVTGINDVLIRVISTSGETNEYRYSFVFNQQLLAEQDHDYSYNLGVFSRRLNNGREYTDQIYFSGFHRYGFSKGATLGINAQLTESHQLLGFQGQLTGLVGALSFDYGLSFMSDWEKNISPINLEGLGELSTVLPEERSSSAYRLQYQYERYSFGALSLSWQYNSPYFLSPHSEPYRVEPALIKEQWIANYSRAINSHLAIGITRRGIDSRVNVESQRRWDLTLTSRLGRYFRLGVQLSELNTWQLGKQYEGVLTLSWQKFTSPNSFDYRYESENQNSVVNVRNQSYLGEHSFQSGLSQSQSYVSDSRISTASVQYDQPRLVGSIGYEQSEAFSNELSVTRFDLGSSIVMANNQWAISRPVSNGFVIVGTDVDLMGKEFVGVNPVRGGGFESKITRYSPAVITSVSPYYVNQIYLDATGTALEYQSGVNQMNMLTAYKTGRLALIQGDETVNIKGRLLHGVGNPIKYQVGDWVNIKSGEATMFFTNENGEFSLQGLSYGQYSLRMYHNDSVSVVLDLNHTVGKVFDVGDLLVVDK